MNKLIQVAGKKIGLGIIEGVGVAAGTQAYQKGKEKYTEWKEDDTRLEKKAEKTAAKEQKKEEKAQAKEQKKAEKAKKKEEKPEKKNIAFLNKFKKEKEETTKEPTTMEEAMKRAAKKVEDQ